MSNTLLAPAMLDSFPGAPFSEDVVDAAVAALRSEAGWHIAPVVTETVTIDATGGVVLMLPTMRLVSVQAVRDMTDSLAPVAMTGWRVSRSGMLQRPLGWPLGFSMVEVDMTHGYAETPADLHAVIAELCQWASLNATVASQSTGPFSITVRDGVRNSTPRLAHYTLPTGA